MKRYGKNYVSFKSVLDKPALGQGVLEPEHFEKYITEIVESDENDILNIAVETKVMSSDVLKLDRLDLVGQFLNAGTKVKKDISGNYEYGEFTEKTNKIVAQYFTGAIGFKEEILKDNIEGAALENTLNNMAAKRTREDVKKLILFSDEDNSSLPENYRQWDGLIKLSANKMDLADLKNGDPEKEVKPTECLEALTQAVPDKFRVPTEFKIFADAQFFNDYHNELIERQTALGDSSLTNGGLTLPYKGYTVYNVKSLNQYFPKSQGGTGRVLWGVIEDNPVWGVNEEVKVDSDRDPREFESYIIYRTRFGTNYKDENASAVIFLDNDTVEVVDDGDGDEPVTPTPAKLATLDFGELVLTPTFDPDKVAYTSATTGSSEVLTLTTTPANATVAVKLNNTPVADYATTGIVWDNGENVVTIEVGDDVPTIYTITVTAS